jgi:hypothetical protein
MSPQHACKTLAARQYASRLFLQNLHLAGHEPDANFIQLIAGCMQTIDTLGYFVLHGLLAGCNLHLAGCQMNEISIQLAVY